MRLLRRVFVADSRLEALPRRREAISPSAVVPKVRGHMIAVTHSTGWPAPLQAMAKPRPLPITESAQEKLKVQYENDIGFLTTYRHVLCSLYDECLSRATMEGWYGFGCAGCPNIPKGVVVLTPPPDDGARLTHRQQGPKKCKLPGCTRTRAAAFKRFCSAEHRTEYGRYNRKMDLCECGNRKTSVSKKCRACYRNA